MTSEIPRSSSGHWSLPLRTAPGWAAILAVAMVVLTLAVAGAWAPLLHLDKRVADWGYRQTYGHQSLTDWWIGVQRYGAPLFQRGLMLVVAVVLVARRHVGAAIWLALLVVVENLVAPSAKYLLSRPRPLWGRPISVEHSTSYPSGHATAAAAFAVAVLLLLPQLAASHTGRLAIGLATVALSGIICADRIFLGVHYLSDVVGGVLLGSVITLVCWCAFQRLDARRSARRV
jgi:membrane-associated phospholipid phosphatase